MTKAKKRHKKQSLDEEDLLEFSKVKSERPKVAVLVYNGLCTFEYGIVVEVLGLFRPEVGGHLYDLFSVSLEGKNLSAFGGLTFEANGEIQDFRTADTIIIPGWRGFDQDVPKAIIDEVNAAHQRGAKIVSICSGIYVLAAAGILSQRKATTHWRYIDDFKKKYPQVELLANDLYVDEGDIVTSAGSSAGLDVCLHIIRSDYGASVANTVARRLVIHAHREGGQAQFIQQPLPKHSQDNRLSKLMETIQADLSQDYTVAKMAKLVDMSPRTMQRRFMALTGVSISQWLSSERLSKACELLETSTLSLEQISASAGFKAPENMRYHFSNANLPSPNYYRKRFLAIEA